MADFTRIVGRYFARVESDKTLIFFCDQNGNNSPIDKNGALDPHEPIAKIVPASRDTTAASRLLNVDRLFESTLTGQLRTSVILSSSPADSFERAILDASGLTASLASLYALIDEGKPVKALHRRSAATNPLTCYSTCNELLKILLRVNRDEKPADDKGLALNPLEDLQRNLGLFLRAILTSPVIPEAKRFGVALAQIQRLEITHELPITVARDLPTPSGPDDLTAAFLKSLLGDGVLYEKLLAAIQKSTGSGQRKRLEKFKPFIRENQ